MKMAIAAPYSVLDSTSGASIATHHALASMLGFSAHVFCSTHPNVVDFERVKAVDLRPKYVTLVNQQQLVVFHRQVSWPSVVPTSLLAV